VANTDSTVTSIMEEIERRIMKRIADIDGIEKDIDDAKADELKGLYAQYDCARTAFTVLDDLLTWIEKLVK